MTVTIQDVIFYTKCQLKIIQEIRVKIKVSINLKECQEHNIIVFK